MESGRWQYVLRYDSLKPAVKGTLNLLRTQLTAFIQWIAAELSARWNEEQQSSCKTPMAQRLTPEIKRSVVETLKTPALLAMYVGTIQGHLYFLAEFHDAQVF